MNCIMDIIFVESVFDWQSILNCTRVHMVMCNFHAQACASPRCTTVSIVRYHVAGARFPLLLDPLNLPYMQAGPIHGSSSTFVKFEWVYQRRTWTLFQCGDVYVSTSTSTSNVCIHCPAYLSTVIPARRKASRAAPPPLQINMNNSRARSKMVELLTVHSGR